MIELFRRRGVSGVESDPFNPPEHHVTNLDDYLRAEQRDRTEPASFYGLPGTHGQHDARERARDAVLGGRDDPGDDELGLDVHLFDDPETLYDLTDGAFAESDLHPLED